MPLLEEPDSTRLGEERQTPLLCLWRRNRAKLKRSEKPQIGENRQRRLLHLGIVLIERQRKESKLGITSLLLLQCCFAGEKKR